MVDVEILPWEQQPAEPSKWFQRFTLFRLQGPGRSIESIWRNEANRSKAKRPSSRWYEIIKLWRWSERASAWDQSQADEIEARWKAKIMGPSEAMAGISDIARGNLADLMDVTPAGFVLKLTQEIDGHTITKPQMKLVKKIKQKVTTYLAKSESEEDREVIETEIELYSAHEAFKDLGKFHGLFVDRSENLNVDLNSLTDDQLERLEAGEDLAHVLKHAST